MFNPSIQKKPALQTDRMKMLRRTIDGPAPGAQPPMQADNSNANRPGSWQPPASTRAVTAQPAQAPIMAPQAQGQQVPSAQPPPPGLDEDVGTFINDIVAGGVGPVDTSEEEALIQELMGDRQGKELVGNRARMGRAGFGESGATAAIEGDIMRKVGQDETGQILDVRDSEGDEAVDNAFRGIELDNEMTNAAEGRALDEKLLEILGADYGSGGAGAGGTPDGAGGVNIPGDYNEGAGYSSSNPEYAGTDADRDGTTDEDEASMASYPGGPEAWKVAQEAGHTEAVRYSVSHQGDFSGLPSRQATASDVLVSTNQTDGSRIYVDSNGNLFRGNA